MSGREELNHKFTDSRRGGKRYLADFRPAAWIPRRGDGSLPDRKRGDSLRIKSV
jgi:hypothetical protein